MASAGITLQRDGWHNQAERLALNHRAVGIAVIVATDQAQRRPRLSPSTLNVQAFTTGSEDGLETGGNDSKPTRRRLAKFNQQVTRETTAARIPNEDVKTLAAQLADKWFAELKCELDSTREELAIRENENFSLQTSLDLTVSEKSRLFERLTEADKRVDELEDELGWARERLVFLENESRSLQTSLDLITSENSRLSHRLTERDTAFSKVGSQLGQIEKALAAAVDETREKRQAKTNTLNTLLEAMSSRAVAAKRLLAEVQQCLLANIEDSSAAERTAADAAYKKRELLQNSLRTKERRVQELEQSHSKLVAGTSTLLKTFKARDMALANAEGRIKLLTERIVQLDAAAKPTKSKGRIEQLDFQLQCELMIPGVLEDARKEAQTNSAQSQCDLDNYVGLNVRCSEQVQVSFADTLLANTITF